MKKIVKLILEYEVNVTNWYEDDEEVDLDLDGWEEYVYQSDLVLHDFDLKLVELIERED